jgi:hypothetical protein
MQVSRLLLILLLLAAPVGFAQQADEGGGNGGGNGSSKGDSHETPVATPGATAPGDNDAETPAQTDTPPLRDEYEPRERISRDKAESFPPDI